MHHNRLIKLIIQSKIDDISLLSCSIKAICNTVVSEPVLLYNIELCLVEAVANVINHAYHRNPDHFIEVQVILNEKEVQFQIIDTGIPATLPSPEKKPSISEEIMNMPESGRGLFLIHHIMDDVSYVQDNGKNIFTMKKSLTKPKTPL